MDKVLTIAGVVWLGLIRRKDAYVLLVLLGALLLATVSLNIFGLGSTGRCVKDVGLTMSLLFGWALAVHAGARELPQEESRGTIFPLLARPVTRAQIVAGKWLGAWSAIAAAALVFLALVALVTLGMGGRLSVAALAQSYALHAVAIGILCAVAVAFSTRMNHDAAAAISYVLTGAAFVFVPRVPAMLVHQRGIGATALLFLYHALPHFEVLDLRKRLVHDYGPAPWGAVALAAAYGAAWIAAVLLLAWLAYRGKRFARGTLAS